MPSMSGCIPRRLQNRAHAADQQSRKGDPSQVTLRLIGCPANNDRAEPDRRGLKAGSNGDRVEGCSSGS